MGDAEKGDETKELEARVQELDAQLGSARESVLIAEAVIATLTEERDAARVVAGVVEAQVAELEQGAVEGVRVTFMLLHRRQDLELKESPVKLVLIHEQRADLRKIEQVAVDRLWYRGARACWVVTYRGLPDGRYRLIATIDERMGVATECFVVAGGVRV